MTFTLGTLFFTMLAGLDVFLQVHEPVQGWMQIIVGLQIIIAIMVSEDLTCLSAGILASQQYITVPLALIASSIGILVADSILYFMGRVAGPSALHRRPLRWFIKPQAINVATKWFDKRGAYIVVLSRFLPGSRVPVFVSAGILSMPFGKYLWLIFASSLVWTPIRIGLAMIMGELIYKWFAAYQNYALALMLVTVLILWILLRQIQRIIHV